MVLRELNEYGHGSPWTEKCGRLICRWCCEPIQAGETVVFDKDNEPWHADCVAEMANTDTKEFVRWLCGVRLDLYDAEDEPGEPGDERSDEGIVVL